MTRPSSGLWDDAVALRLIGKTVLVGMTFAARGDQPERHEQFHGVVVEADRARGVLLQLSGVRAGELYRLPAATSTFAPAERGIYRLKTGGEEVVDPDYFSTWTVQPPQT